MFKLVSLSFLILSLSSGCVSQEDKSPKRQEGVKRMGVNTTLVQLKQVEDLLVFPGVVKSKSQSKLSFATGGRLISREVQVGDHLKAGDLVARLDQKGFAIGVNAASASLKSSREQRDQLLRDVKRARQLDSDGAFTKSNLEKIESALLQAESGLQASKQALRESKRMRGETRLRAPFDGVITTVYTQAGEVIGAGHPIARIVGKDGMEVIIEVSSDVVGKISSAEKVVLFTKSGVEVEASIRTIVKNATTESGLHPVMIDLPKQPKISDGIDVSVKIKTASSNALLIPINAIVDPSGQKPFVWVVKGGRVKKASIQFGNLYGKSISVKGLTADSTIVISGQERLLENDEVSEQKIRTLASGMLNE